MKRPNITPGPWILDPDERRDGFWIDSDTTEPEEIANACTSHVDSAQAKANAEAIAALPSLLGALELQSQVEGPSMTLLHDDESVEGWQWEHPATGQTWTAIGQHDEPAPFFPPVKSALTLAGYEF